MNLHLCHPPLCLGFFPQHLIVVVLSEGRSPGAISPLNSTPVSVLNISCQAVMQEVFFKRKDQTRTCVSCYTKLTVFNKPKRKFAVLNLLQMPLEMLWAVFLFLWHDIKTMHRAVVALAQMWFFVGLTVMAASKVAVPSQPLQE